ncbi:MAG: hypothetical protein ACOC1V_04890 [Candidatus Saliniplasma sp.]
MDKANSVDDVPIQLTKERWFHITEGHPEMAGYYHEILDTVEDLEGVYAGHEDE